MAKTVPIDGLGSDYTQLLTHDQQIGQRAKMSLDKIIGSKVRAARKDLRYTVGELCRIIGRSSQQLQKYETGQNRISAALLMEFSKLFDRPIDWFFETAGSAESADRTPDQHPDFETCLYLLKQLKSADTVSEIRTYLAKAVAANRQT